ncbi:hypothetical protein SLA2020_355870 [Shorea laevis]
MAQTAAASTSRLAESVPDMVPLPSSAPLALVPLSSQDDAHQSGSAAVRKGKEVQSATLNLPSKVSPLAPPLSQYAPKRSDFAQDYFASTELLLQNHRNFARSTAPSRLMYFENGDWIDFSSEVVDQLRPAFANRRAMVDVLIDGSKYLFDFMRMLQIDFKTENYCSVSWIDENGKCFFPKISIGKEEEFTELENNEYMESCANGNGNISHNIELVIKLDDSLLKRKRAEFEATPPTTALPTPPVTVLPVITEDVPRRPQFFEVYRWPKATILREGDKEHTLIKNYFLAGVRKLDPFANVTAIYKCTREGHSQKARYEAFQNQIELTRAIRGADAATTIHAWHGASEKEVATILAYGFRSPTKVPASDVYGVGVYLSPIGLPQLSASLAEADENGEKHVILCRILLGNVEKVEFGSQQDLPSRAKFDTGSDDPKNPTWHVVWSYNMNKHIFPEFVVSYKPFGNAQGQMKAARCTGKEFISKVGDSLPPAQFQEVVHLYKMFQAGLLAKDDFIRRFRFIAGENILKSVIREINDSG